MSSPSRDSLRHQPPSVALLDTSATNLPLFTQYAMEQPFDMRNPFVGDDASFPLLQHDPRLYDDTSFSTLADYPPRESLLLADQTAPPDLDIHAYLFNPPQASRSGLPHITIDTRGFSPSPSHHDGFGSTPIFSQLPLSGSPSTAGQTTPSPYTPQFNILPPSTSPFLPQMSLEHFSNSPQSSSPITSPFSSQPKSPNHLYPLSPALLYSPDFLHSPHPLPPPISPVTFTPQLIPSVLDIASGFPAPGDVLPQRPYRPHTQSDRRRYVEEVELEPPIIFYMQNPEGCGISCKDALNSKFMRLSGRDDQMFINRGPSISIRLNWPGYPSWSRQIPTRDFRTPPGPITRSKLAKNVAKTVQRFLLDMAQRPLEDGADARWTIGHHHIRIEDLDILGLQHVSMGSWQVHLRVRRRIHV